LKVIAEADADMHNEAADTGRMEPLDADGTDDWANHLGHLAALSDNLKAHPLLAIPVERMDLARVDRSGGRAGVNSGPQLEAAWIDSDRFRRTYCELLLGSGNWAGAHHAERCKCVEHYSAIEKLGGDNGHDRHSLTN
jgi:hypothetical protein